MDGIFAELTNWPEYAKIFLGIYALVSPPIVLPIFLTLLADRTAEEKRKAAGIAAFAFLVSMLVFTFTGELLLSVFGITVPGFRAAGGFLLLLVAIDLIRADTADHEKLEKAVGSLVAISIVPITVPMLAGPGAISAVVVFATQHATDPLGHKIVVSIVLMILAFIIYLTYRFAAVFDRFFTPEVSVVVSKIMGLIIAAIAIEFMIYGFAGHFPQFDII
ncbi:MAG: MarC family protein [Pseudomonadota bacterium]